MRSSRVREVLDTGRKVHGKRLVMFVCPGDGQVAVVAGRRVGGAVQRNRAKRILRAAWRSIGPNRDIDVVMVARQSISGKSSTEIARELSEMRDRMSREDD